MGRDTVCKLAVCCFAEPCLSVILTRELDVFSPMAAGSTVLMPLEINCESSEAIARPLARPGQ